MHQQLMDKVRLYRILDIDHPDEFQYYENLSALLEEDEFIEENLIKDLVRSVDKERLAEHIESYFEEFLRHIPDSETDLYVLVESMKRAFEGLIFEGMDDSDISDLSSELLKFRRWYVHDLNAFDRISGREVSVRDARFGIAAARLLGDKADFDFRPALDYDLEGFSVRVADMIATDTEEDRSESD